MENSIDDFKTIEDDFTSYTVELKEGQLLGVNRNYRLEKNLGVGGMGEVWLAAKILEGKEVRKVVVKTLRPDRRGNEGAQEKALKQFQLIQTLNHTNICPIYDIEKDPACGYLIVMGYAGGGSYADWFAEKPKSLTEVCRVLRPIADALDFAHSKGVIHRDVKPANMMFTEDGTPWLIDFGIATRLQSESKATTGQFAQSGTLSYMAPEQKMGKLQTNQTDEYSLAMVVLEFLTGTTFLQTVQVLQLEIQRVLNKALALKPSNRYTTCRAFIDALSRMTKEDPVRKPVPAKRFLNHLAETDKEVEEFECRTEEEKIRQQITSLEEQIGNEYQSGRYNEAITLLNELLRFNPTNPNAQWLLKHATQKLEIQKKKEAKLKFLEKARHKVHEESAPDIGLRQVLTCDDQIEIAFCEEHERKADERKILTCDDQIEIAFCEEHERKAGERKILIADEIEYTFHWCPPGEFMMGGNRHGDEEPIHKVNLTKGFWMLETQVTQEMWQNVMGKNPSSFKAKRNPVENVSWNDCAVFCQELSLKLGQQVQLPTEAQWEYACRAGTTGDYAGDLDSMAWYRNNSDSMTHEVGNKKPNAWGLYDMHGNVWEWCSDYYDADYYSKSPTSDPENTNVSSDHVLRGGGWRRNAGYCRSARRNKSGPCNWGSRIGLRVLLVPSPDD